MHKTVQKHRIHKTVQKHRIQKIENKHTKQGYMKHKNNLKNT
jgi:hypothetical protein